MSSSEEVAYPILRKHDVDYVLVIFGGLIGYSGDDINKFLWMVRIAQGVWPDEIQETNYFTPNGEYRVDDRATTTMKESLMYKMSYYRFVQASVCLADTRTHCCSFVHLDSMISLEEDKPQTGSASKPCLKLDQHWTILVCGL